MNYTHLKAQSDDCKCIIHIPSIGTTDIALEKLISVPNEKIVEDVKRIFKENNIDLNKPTSFYYSFIMLINKDGSIRRMVISSDKMNEQKENNEKIIGLVKSYIQSLAPFTLTPYIDKDGKPKEYLEVFRLYLHIDYDTKDIKITITP
ncbi:hypothetical protein AD998_17080 [bacterium 336/3]|nr:hypothetical protein AD998_17080 [bacterium 336/3]